MHTLNRKSYTPPKTHDMNPLLISQTIKANSSETMYEIA